MDIKKAYTRFRQWQANPFDHEFSTQDTHTCINCGHDFKGNFCPYCSQKSDLGRITWRSVSKSIAEVWGMHNRSLSYSIVQLFLRPGYFISDYISGKRQVSFPPVKMLVIIAVIGVIVDFLTGAIYGVIRLEKVENLAYVNNTFTWLNDVLDGAFPPPSDFLSKVFDWINTHPDVLSLVLLSFLIIPNYFIFRFAPRNTCHTIPQGFFIQVFSSSVFLILNMFYDITSLGWLVFIFGISMIFMTYKQLFGYGIWGTLWRIVVAFICAFTLLSILLNVNYGVHMLQIGRIADAHGLFIYIPAAILTLIFLLVFSYFISKSRSGSVKKK